MGFIDSTIKNDKATADTTGTTTFVNTTVNGKLENTQVDEDVVAMVNGILYNDLAEAVEKAPAGAVVTLLNPVELDLMEKEIQRVLLPLVRI